MTRTIRMVHLRGEERPSYCYPHTSLEGDPHTYVADLTLVAFAHGPVTRALLTLECPDGDEMGTELDRDDLERLRDTINAIL